MATNFITRVLIRNSRRYSEISRIFALLLMFLSVSGLNVKETRLSSSQHHKLENDKISIRISESVKDTRTLDKNPLNEKLNNFVEPIQNVILSTELLTNSSYIEAEVNKGGPITERLEKDLQETKHFSFEGSISNHSVETDGSSTQRNYYETIKPTKTVSIKELKIVQTEIKDRKSSGEDKGVSKKDSRPLKLRKKMNYSRVKRGFGNTSEDPFDEQKFTSKTAETGKQVEKNNLRKNYNQIEQTLGKIAKITINDEKMKPVEATVAPSNFRESRDEENRKASPDIQDIITGIVNILNGKTTKVSEGNTGRPRPTGTRINNRGPPRISDVPPLDFDGPPAYRPLPPPPPKRIPPPFPFDIPPSMPNIPLPPQPHKPGLAKLPSHPFIDGVPIPEIVIPKEQLKKPPYIPPPEPHNPEYDTISMSESINEENLHPIVGINTTKVVTSTPAVIKNVSATNEYVKLESNVQNYTLTGNNNQTFTTANATHSKPDYNKLKVSGQKVPLSSVNKNSNKRVRPNSTIRPNEKPSLNKTITASPVLKEEKNKTTSMVVTTISNGSKIEPTKTNPSSEMPLKEEIINGTKKTGEMVESPLKTSTNVTSVLNVKLPLNDTGVKKTIDKLPGIVDAAQSGDELIKYAEKQNETEKYEIALEIPVMLEPTIGFGEATPVLESSIFELSMLPNEQTKTTTTIMSTQRPGQPIMTETSSQYKARPGIVLDDPEYKPGGHKRPVIATRPIITAPPPHSHYGEIFDVTVHAVQGPGDEISAGKPFIVPVEIEGVQVQNPQVVKGDVSVITKPEEGQNFVSIDGKRTYINLFGEVSSTKINPTTTQAPITGTGYVIPHKETPVHQPSRPAISTSPPRKPYKRPSHPPVRIDTCIVGDDTTCDSAQNEMCRTEDGVSSCHCRPGYNRRKHRDTCRRVVSMLTSLRVDRLYDRKVKWQDTLRDPYSEEYQQLSYEASQAIESAMSMTPFSDDFITSRINSIYTAKNLENNEPAVYVNVTIQLEENLDTMRPAVKQDIQRHLLRVIQRRNNNVGNSAIWVDAPPGSILALQDVDECSSSELHDCHESAICLNIFGSFKCQCPTGSRDPWSGNIHREGRFCETCSSEYCNNRGECNFEHGQQVCHCSGSFYGAQCEIDGEVLGVAIGASVAAAIIIILTLICLCMWSRRWSREQKSAVGAGMGSPVFGYMATGPAVKTPSIGGPPYQVSIEDRIRWAQIADVMAKANHYAQPEPVNATTRTSFGGYPTLPSHTMSMAGTLPLPKITPPVPLPRLTLANKQPMGTYGAHSQLGSIHQSNHGIRSSLETTSSSEEEDRADLLGRNFNVPRPKSRTSVANQSGIYYDVDFDRSDAYSKQNTIPMNTYSLSSQHQVRPYFR